MLGQILGVLMGFLPYLIVLGAVYYYMNRENETLTKGVKMFLALLVTVIVGFVLFKVMVTSGILTSTTMRSDSKITITVFIIIGLITAAIGYSFYRMINPPENGRSDIDIVKGLLTGETMEDIILEERAKDMLKKIGMLVGIVIITVIIALRGV